MRMTKWFWIFPSIYFLACSQDKITVEEPSDAEIKLVKEIAQPAAGLLLSTLQSELLTAIGTSGVNGALEVCNRRALVLTDSIQLSSERITGLKRTSMKYRNPRNAPDEPEERALAYFNDRLQSDGSLPDDLVQKIKDSHGTSFRYYKPLTVKPLCLNCHGGSTQMDSQVLKTIGQLYAQDKATGYEVGDFRGVIRVSVKLP